MTPETMTVKVPLSPINKWTVGPFMEKYYAGMKEKKLLGIKCAQCQRVYVPPRKKCGRCFLTMTDWVDVQQKGTLQSYTIGYVDIDPDIKHRTEPIIVVLAKLDGADSFILGALRGADPKSLQKGSAVEIQWVERPAGSVADYFLKVVK